MTSTVLADTIIEYPYSKIPEKRCPEKMMKSIVLTHSIKIIAVFILLNLPSSLSGGPFISINSINADKEYPAIQVTATIQNRHGSAMSGLDEENILVYEDGYRVNYVKVMDLSSSEDYCYLVFAIDSSKSISEKFFHAIKNYAAEIITSTGSRDRIALYRFNDTVSLLSNFSLKRNDLTAKISSLDRHGSKTQLFDAIYDSLQLLSSTHDGIHRGAVFFTDGKDEGSSITEKDVISHAKKLGIPLSFMCPGSSSHLKRMKRLAKLTGGEVYTSSDKQKISSIYQEMIRKLKTRYRILYRTIAPADGKNHNLEVRLRQGNLQDRDTRAFLIERRFFSSIAFDGYGPLFFILVIIILGILAALVYICLKPLKKKSTGPGKSQKVSPGTPCYQDSSDDEALYLVDEDFSYDDAEEDHEGETSYTSAWLVEKHGSSTGVRNEITSSEFTIGYAEDNQVSIDDEYLSDYHARIKRVRDSFFLFDLASDSGTYLNGKKLLRPRILYDWDEITIAGYHFIFRGTIKTGL